MEKDASSQHLSQILEAGGGYVWMVKDNQPILRAEVEELFTADDLTVEGGHVVHDFQTVAKTEKGHGRIERRTLTTSSELKGYSEWPGMEQVFRLDRYRVNTKTGEVEEEVSYGLTSLSAAEASPQRLLGYVREYWGIENGLHRCRDVTFHKDRTRMTKGKTGHVVASLNNLAIGILRHAGATNVAAARRWCQANLLTLPSHAPLLQ